MGRIFQWNENGNGYALLRMFVPIRGQIKKYRQCTVFSIYSYIERKYLLRNISVHQIHLNMTWLVSEASPNVDSMDFENSSADWYRKNIHIIDLLCLWTCPESIAYTSLSRWMNRPNKWRMNEEKFIWLYLNRVIKRVASLFLVCVEYFLKYKYMN